MSGVRWKGRKGGRIVRWLGWRGGVMRSQFGKGGREAKDKQGFTAGTCVEIVSREVRLRISFSIILRVLLKE